jgi:hypothetical protein
MSYRFDKERISQHIVRYHVDVRPAIDRDQDRSGLLDYAHWLVGQFPDAFETMLSGPGQLWVQRTFLLPNTKRVELPTFVPSHSGPVFTFPERLYLDRPHELRIPGRDDIFRKALEELRARFPDRIVPKVGVIHEFVFDTGYINALDVIASHLRHDLWRQQVQDLRIQMEVPADGRNVNIEIRPTNLQYAGKYAGPVTPEDMKYGIVVNAEISGQQLAADLTKTQVSDILAFARSYVPDGLLKFLNNED